MTKGGAYALGTQAYFEGWGVSIEIVGPYSDSSAGLGFGARRGLGKMRHIETRYLWLQDIIAQKALGPRKIDTEKKPSDVLTKAQTKAKLVSALEFIGQRPVTSDKGQRRRPSRSTTTSTGTRRGKV